MKHGKQHFVPKSYLKAWCDPNTPSTEEPYVWQFNRDGSESKRKAPHNIFKETDMYTIKQIDGTRDLILEHGLSGLEEVFVGIREKIINCGQLEPEEHIDLCAFIAALRSRTKSQREHWKQQWEHPLKMMEDLIEWGKTATVEEKKKMANFPSIDNKKNGHKFNYEQVKELATQPLQKIMFPMIAALTPLLCKLDVAILETFSEPGFITSDDPCVWFDSKAYKRPPLFQAPGLMYPSIEIRLPITRNYMILLNRRGIEGYLRLNESLTDEMNRITRFCSHEYFIVNKDVSKAIWFDPGKEPDDTILC